MQRPSKKCMLIKNLIICAARIKIHKYIFYKHFKSREQVWDTYGKLDGVGKVCKSFKNYAKTL